MKLFVVFALAWACCGSAHSVSAIYDPEHNQILQQQGEDRPRSIASLTKLMTAMVVLNSGQSRSDLLPLSTHQASVLPPKQYSRLELLHALLVHSDNAAAETLAEHYPGGRYQFVRDMNRRAEILGMKNTKFVDPSGLGVFNISTLKEVSVMLAESRKYELIRTISTLPSVQLRQHWLPNTSSSLLTRLKNVVVSKTGFTNHAGFCAGMVVMHRGRELVLVVLGEPTKQQRVQAMDQLVRNI